MALKEMPKVGDKVRYIGGDCDFLTAGKSYEVIGTCDRLFDFIDDDGEIIDSYLDDEWELISEGADNMTQYIAEQRQARKGERIVIVEPNVHDSEDYERGDIFRVDKVDSAGVVTTTGNIVYHEEYEVLPEDMSEGMPTLPTTTDISDAVKAWQKLGYSADDYTLEKRDNVNNPAHYAQGKFETIDIIANIVAGYSDPFVGHCVGTAVKYVSRAPYKHDTPLEDMRKAKRYIEFAIERLEGER